MRDLDLILERLERHRQPVTYGAVGGVVGRISQSVMRGRPRSPLNSWVVNASTRRPTGYDPHQMHPDLLAAVESKGVIATPEELSAWLRSHG